MTDLTALILSLLERTSSQAPLRIRDLQQRLTLYGSAPSDRTIKGAIEELRRRGHRIGARRDLPAGYYLIRSAEDAALALRSYRQQFLSEIQTARATLPPSAWRELSGQLRIELEAER